ncbi:MAG: DUF397 domain-containing protein [Pseudonocardiaceae bacterium]
MIIQRPELAHAVWQVSSYSGNSGNCVEVADLTARRAVRDSKNPTGPVLILSTAEWSAFTTGVRSSEFG